MQGLIVTIILHTFSLLWAAISYDGKNAHMYIHIVLKVCQVAGSGISLSNIWKPAMVDDGIALPTSRKEFGHKPYSNSHNFKVITGPHAAMIIEHNSKFD